jgi:hypothetical protein
MRRSRRIGLLGAVVLALLVALAKMHACMCTGGPPQWHSIGTAPTSAPQD